MLKNRISLTLIQFLKPITNIFSQTPQSPDGMNLISDSSQTLPKKNLKLVQNSKSPQNQILEQQTEKNKSSSGFFQIFSFMQNKKIEISADKGISLYQKTLKENKGTKKFKKGTILDSKAD